MHNYIEQINSRLNKLLSECNEPLLQEVMTYAVLGPGKRIRPLLLLATNEVLLGNYSDTALDFACAIEMIHAYSLAHDDLPAMDNDDFRRGRPTCHKAFDDAMAILAGDALLSFAVEIMTRRIKDGSVESQQAAKALNCVIKAAGANGMIAGQVSDIKNEGKQINAETLAAIHRRKTGCLFTASFEAGGLLGSADESITKKLVDLGNILGMAFQIKDDILDVTSTAENLGKPIGSDERNQKSTYVTIHGMEAAETEYQRRSQESFEILNKISSEASTLHKLISQTLTRTK